MIVPDTAGNVIAVVNVIIRQLDIGAMHPAARIGHLDGLHRLAFFRLEAADRLGSDLIIITDDDLFHHTRRAIVEKDRIFNIIDLGRLPTGGEIASQIVFCHDLRGRNDLHRFQPDDEILGGRGSRRGLGIDVVHLVPLDRHLDGALVLTVALSSRGDGSRAGLLAGDHTLAVYAANAGLAALPLKQVRILSNVVAIDRQGWESPRCRADGSRSW